MILTKLNVLKNTTVRQVAHFQSPAPMELTPGVAMSDLSVLINAETA